MPLIKFYLLKRKKLKTLENNMNIMYFVFVFILVIYLYIRILLVY